MNIKEKLVLKYQVWHKYLLELSRGDIFTTNEEESDKIQLVTLTPEFLNKFDSVEKAKKAYEDAFNVNFNKKIKFQWIFTNENYKNNHLQQLNRRFYDCMNGKEIKDEDVKSYWITRYLVEIEEDAEQNC